MKISKLMLGLMMTFVIALGSAFYVNSSLADNTVCGDGWNIAGAACGKCGDGYCNPRCGETATSCPRDCGVSSSK